MVVSTESRLSFGGETECGQKANTRDFHAYSNVAEIRDLTHSQRSVSFISICRHLSTI